MLTTSMTNLFTRVYLEITITYVGPKIKVYYYFLEGKKLGEGNMLLSCHRLHVCVQCIVMFSVVGLWLLASLTH